MIQNLIPKKDKDDIKDGYKVRVIVTFAWCIFAVSIIASTLLVPPFAMAFYRIGSISQNNTDNNTLSPDKQAEIMSEAKVINQKSEFVLSLKDSVDIVERIIEIDKSKSDSISIKSMAYGGSDNMVIKLEGVAKDRQSLIDFQKSLETIPFVKDAQVPVDAFAKDTDLPFSMDIETTK